MTVAIAAGLAVGCSDDLNLEQKATLHVEKGDLVGTLYSESPTRVAMLDQQNSQGYPAVWSEDDNVNVFSPIRLNFNNYTLKEGAGTNQAVFQPIEEDPTLLQATDLYAITAASYQYGVSKVSADPDDKDVLLTAEIPAAFDWEKVVADNGQEVDAYKMPSPWWGPASFGSNGELNVAFRPLTAVVRVDLADLPAGVNSIVLVTGNSTAVGAAYQVGEVDENGAPKPATLKDYVGTGEGISGTFNCVLSLGNSTETALGIDRHLLCEDTLRVDLPEATEALEDKVLFIPLIAQHYDKLQVIAVQADDVMPYIWYGEVLRTYSDLVVNNGDLLNLSQAAKVELTETSPLAISSAIADLYDGKHALVVDVPNITFANSDDNTLYIVHNAKSELGQTSVTINFPETITEGDGVNIAERTAILTGNVPNNGSQFFKWGTQIFKENFPATLNKTTTDWEPKVQSEDKQRTVRLNFSKALTKPVNVTLPTSNVEMTSEQPISVNIITSNYQNVSGYDFDATYNAVSNEQNAALKFTGVYSVVNYGGTGAVYFLEEDSEITEELNIFGKNPRSLRITDALINTISYPTLGTGTNSNYSSAATPTAYIFTTGSAAIKKLNENGNKVKIKAFWTSRRLTPYAVEAGYEGDKVSDINVEKGAIYTAAQLQGMGLSEKVYQYTISPKVESIWLGGVTFPWIGAEIETLTPVAPTATVSAGTTAPSVPVGAPTWAYKYGNGGKVAEKVSLDGRNVTLKNMILDIYDPNVVLPGCCGTTQKIRLTKNLGLIRSIRTKKTVDLFNIQLDDVLLDAHQYAIDNIGSLTGIIQAEDTVRIGGTERGKTVSNFTDIRIASKGNQIGGIVGELETKGAPVEIDNVKVESIEANNQYITGGHIQGKNNVGGIAGRISYDGAYDAPKANPDAAGSVVTKWISDYSIYPVTMISIAKNGYMFTDPDGVKSAMTEAAAISAIYHKYYINDIGSAVYVTSDTEKPKATMYYDDAACTTKYGSFSAAYTADANEFWYNNYKNQVSDISTQQLYKKNSSYSGEIPAKETETVTAADAPTEYQMLSQKLEKATKPYNWTGVTYYVVVTDKQTKSQTINGGEYPTALDISNATVNFNLASDGIILGEKGNNVGGTVGFAVINGPTNIFKAITVTVPTIKATIPNADTAKPDMKSGMPEIGNNVGGLIGTYYNVNTSEDPVTQSRFGGTITSSKGIYAESGHAGGVIGQQTAANLTPKADYSDDMQVFYGNDSDLKVTVGELKAVNGYVGGLVGYQESGKIAANTGGAFELKIVADKMIGANSIGGLIGEQIDITYIGGATKPVSVDIKAVELTKPIAYFETNADRNYCGTIGTLVGMKNHWLSVDGTINSQIEGDKTLSDTRKEELLFKYNVSAATTLSIQDDKAFYGDKNGYIGVAKQTGTYFVGGVQQGNYQYNVYENY